MLNMSRAWGAEAPVFDVAAWDGHGEQVAIDVLHVRQRVPLDQPVRLPDEGAAWEATRPGIRALGFPGEGAWMRGALRNSSAQAQTRWLVVAEPFTDQVECIIRDEGGSVGAQERVYRMGDQRPYSSRPISALRFIVPFEIPAQGSSRFHCYARNNGALTVAFEVWRPDHYAQLESELAVARSLCYGALLFAMACGVMLTIIQRRALPILLIVEVLPVLVGTVMREGDAFALLWPAHPELNIPPFSVIPIGVMAAALVFRRIIALSEREDLIIKALIGLAGALLVPVLSFGWLGIQVGEIVQYMAVGVPLLVIGMCLRHWREGALPRILAFGMIVQFIGLIINAAGVLGYIASGYFLASLYTSVIKSLSLAAAVAYRMRQDRQERDRAQSNHMEELEQRVAYEAQLRHAVSHHPRYGMPNQALLEESVRTCLPDAPAPGVAVWVLRLNRFGFLESILPRDTLTELVKVYANELARWFSERRDFVLLAIDGGHRIAALDDGTLCFVTFGEPSPDLLADLSAFVTRRFERHGLFVAWDPHVGVGVIPCGDSRESGLTEEARVALQWCGPHRRVVRFDAGRMKREQLAYGLTLDLEGAIERGELVLHYQPKIELPSRKTVSLEALVRWRHPVRGMIPPGSFIAEAEATGAINRLTMWAIREAARFLLTLPDDTVRVSVNITAFDLATPLFVKNVLQVLTQEKCPPSRLILEITESAALSDKDRATEILSELRAKGVQIALDDFGTGYSSLAILQEMPLDEMKVDRSFVTDIGEFDRKQAVLEAMIDVGHRLGLTVTIEGVEHEESVDWLARNGCDVVQGFVFSRPLEASVARDWVTRHGPDQSPAPAQTVSAAPLSL
ncbi:MAG: EAL domain-containing protein [Burkholderiales bacterium]|nr:EAL domain-containing protein [Burkholderiales bacterium]